MERFYMSYVVAIECADGREVVAGQLSNFKKAEERAAQICHVLYHKDQLYNDLQAQGYDPRNVIVRAKAGKMALASFPFDPDAEHDCGHDHA